MSDDMNTHVLSTITQSKEESLKLVRYSLHTTFLNQVTGELESTIKEFAHNADDISKLRTEYEEALKVCSSVHIYQKETIITEISKSEIDKFNH